MTTGREVLDAIAGVHEELQDLRRLVEQMARNAEELYCPPSEHCAGGVLLRLHAETYWKNDGKDIDRFYHPLPEADWYPYTGEGAFKGSLVRNHSVWRSAALRTPPGVPDSADVYEQDEVLPEVARAERRHDARDRAEPSPVDAGGMRNDGDFFAWAWKKHGKLKTKALQVPGVADALNAHDYAAAQRAIEERVPAGAK